MGFGFFLLVFLRIPSVWCYPYVSPCPAPPAVLYLKTVGQFPAGRAYQKAGELPISPCKSPSQASQREAKRCSGKHRLKLPAEPCLCLTMGGMQWLSGVRGACSPFLSALGSVSLLKRELSSFFWLCVCHQPHSLSICLYHPHTHLVSRNQRWISVPRAASASLSGEERLQQL